LTLLGNALAGPERTWTVPSDRLNAAIQVDPGQGSLYSNLGVLQLARGDRQLARGVLQEGDSRDARSCREPGRAGALLPIARARCGGGNDPDEALAINPASIQVNSNLAELYIQRDRPLEAEAPLKAIAEARQDAASKFALADYYTGTNRPKQAAAILDSLTATKETYALAKARLAAIDYTEGRASEAHAILDELLKREPHSRIGQLLKARLLLL